MTNAKVSIKELLNELEKLGVNVSQLKRLHERGNQLDALQESLMKLCQAHLIHRELKEHLKHEFIC